MRFQNRNELSEDDLYADFPLVGFTDEHRIGRQKQSDSQRKPSIKITICSKKKRKRLQGRGEKGSTVLLLSISQK